MRDLILGRAPEDYDVATSATPDEVRSLFPKGLELGAKFATVTVILDGRAFEVSTFRGGEGPGEVGSPERDAKLRDFTINALFYDPIKGLILDYVGGREHLRRGLITTAGNPRDRFLEDPLRMLRAARLAANMGFLIDRKCLKAARELSEELTGVSPERVRDELAKSLEGRDPARGIRLMAASGLLEKFLPEVAAMGGVPQPAAFHPEGEVLEHTLRALGCLENPTLTLALGTLLHDAGKPLTFREEGGRITFYGHQKLGAEVTRSICRRLHFPQKVIERVVELVESHMRFIHVRDMRPARLIRFLRMSHFGEHLALHRADCLASHRSLVNYEFCREQLALLAPEVLRPEPLISGHDLIASGLRPGPIFKKLLLAVEEAQLEGRVKSREEALGLALSLAEETEGFVPREAFRAKY